MNFQDNQPKQTYRLMLEVTPSTMIAMAKALRSQATGVPVVHTLEEYVALSEVAQKIISRISEEQDAYPGKVYQIWAKGKRRSHLGFKREPDMFIGSAIGRNFLDSCIHFCTCICFTHGAYNPKDNTLGGYILYSKEE